MNEKDILFLGIGGLAVYAFLKMRETNEGVPVVTETVIANVQTGAPTQEYLPNIQENTNVKAGKVEELTGLPNLQEMKTIVKKKVKNTDGFVGLPNLQETNNINSKTVTAIEFVGLPNLQATNNINPKTMKQTVISTDNSQQPATIIETMHK